MPIHPTAVVDSRAQIDPSADIGPYAIVGPDVQIGARTRVLAHACIVGFTIIGADNEIHTGAAVGTAPQHLAYKGAPVHTIIGDHNIIREYASINGSFVEGSRTVIGSDNYLMIQSHVGHDCIVGNRIVLCNGSLLSGHVEVEDRAFISGLVAVHQFTRVGELVMCAGITRVNRDVPPYMMVYGDSEVVGLNVVGLRRAGISAAARAEIGLAYEILFEQRRSLPSAIAALKSEPRCPEVQHIIAFLEKSKRGICGGRRFARGGEPSAEA
jgi:UDP-N-acetylglucosamine acyltransferase